MKIAAICCTYNRPEQLAEAIESFERQTYPLDKREMIVLDDAGQYEPQCGPGWQLVTTTKRFRTLGEKRNASAALASADVDAYAVWDDDDIYLPDHLEAMAHVFESGAPWSLPEKVWIDRRSHLERKRTNHLFHGAWGFTREAFLSVNGYPAMQSGQDQALAARLCRAGIRPVSSTAEPTYIYRWHTYPTARHLSAMGQGGYERRAEEKVERLQGIQPRWIRDWCAVPRK